MWAQDDYSLTFVEMKKMVVFNKPAFQTGARVTIKFHRGYGGGGVEGRRFAEYLSIDKKWYPSVNMMNG